MQQMDLIIISLHLIHKKVFTRYFFFLNNAFKFGVNYDSGFNLGNADLIYGGEWANGYAAIPLKLDINCICNVK